MSAGEFREQATAILMAGLYEAHDSANFEIIAFDNGGSDDSAMRRAAGSGLRPIRATSGICPTATRRRASRRADIDILVNLNGYFGEHRMGVFAHAPAPLQVNYLGFPGHAGRALYGLYHRRRDRDPATTNSASMTRRSSWLPDSYQVNDDKRPRPGSRQPRGAAACRKAAFVFCNFNHATS